MKHQAERIILCIFSQRSCQDVYPNCTGLRLMICDALQTLYLFLGICYLANIAQMFVQLIIGA